MNMVTDLLPAMELPYVVVVTTMPGASPEQVESQITAPLEAGLGTVNGVANVTSTSSENVSTVVLEFDGGTNMDSAMVNLSTAVDQVRGALPDTAGNPMLLQISPDMLPVMIAAVDMEGMDVYQLTDFASETVIPAFERQAGVASVSGTGLVEKSVEIRLNEEKIEAINTKVLASVDEELADAKAELDDAKKKVEDGRAELERELEEGINRDITIMLGYQPPILIKPVIALNKEARSAVLEELKIVPTSTDYIAITVNMEGGADHE